MAIEWKSAVMNRRFQRLVSGMLLGLIATGCQKDGEITRYSVPRKNADKPSRPVEPQSGELAASPAEHRHERMLAAIIARTESVWFFKLVGPEELVAEQAGRFRKFVESVRFADKGEIPEWKLPDGWRRQPASGMRHATIEISSSKEPLELAVTPLKTGGEDFHDYVLANVDRWRLQLGLPPTSKTKLFGPSERSGELIEVKLDDGEKALLVNLVSDPGSSVARGPADTSPNMPAGLASTLPKNKSPLSFKAPAGWSPGKVDGMRQVAYKIKDGSKEAEVTVIALAASAGDLLANVNRWRDQVHLGPVVRDELDRQMKEFLVDGVKGHRVELVGPTDAQPREAILGVICSRQDKAWFFKLKGDAELVERERVRFESFVQSVRFDGSDGANDGH